MQFEPEFIWQPGPGPNGGAYNAPPYALAGFRGRGRAQRGGPGRERRKGKTQGNPDSPREIGV